MSDNVERIEQFVFRGCKVKIKYYKPAISRDKKVEAVKALQQINPTKGVDLRFHRNAWDYYRETVKQLRGCIRSSYRSVHITVTNGKHMWSDSYQYSSGMQYRKVWEVVKNINNNIKRDREQSRKILTIEKQFQGMRYPVIYERRLDTGRGIDRWDNRTFITAVHKTSGEILRLKKAKVLNDYFQASKPLTDEPHIGIELECITKCTDRHELAARFHEVNPELSKHIDITYDGSLNLAGVNDSERDKYKGREIRIVAPESKINQIVIDVCSVLSQFNSIVNTSCGLHVHLDCRNKEPREVFNRLYRFQTFLYNLNPKSRLKNQYSKRTNNRNFNQRSSRYQGINPHSYRRHRTIEVRIHAGTVNATKINHWVKILTRIVNLESIDTIKRCPRNVDRIGQILNLDSETLTYAKQRIARFAA